MSQNNNQQPQQSKEMTPAEKGLATKAANAEKAAAEKAAAEKAAAEKAAAEKAAAEKAKVETFKPKKGAEGHYHVEIENKNFDQNTGKRTSKPQVITLEPKMFSVFCKGGHAGYIDVKVVWDPTVKKCTNKVLMSPEILLRSQNVAISEKEAKLEEIQKELEELRQMKEEMAELKKRMESK